MASVTSVRSGTVAESASAAASQTLHGLLLGTGCPNGGSAIGSQTSRTWRAAKLGLTITSEKTEGRGRVYRVQTA